MNEEWISCKIELPPCNGMYRVTIDKKPPELDLKKTFFGEGLMDYDGYGFKSGNVYQDNITYWLPYRRKKYGKI